MVHLIYCDKKARVYSKLLDGTKTMIVRGAAGRKIPHSRVFAKEIAYFIENDGSGQIKARGIIKSAFCSEKLTEEESNSLIDKHMEKLNLTAKQQKRWRGKKYLTLVEVEDIQPIEPMKLNCQKYMDDWLIVDKIEDIVEGTEDNYKNLDYNNKKGEEH